jgi:hypothetical protein
MTKQRATSTSRPKGTASQKGRPSKFTKELAARICTRLAAGESLRAICRAPDMPAGPTVRQWVLNNEEFAKQYTLAREIGYQEMADEIIDIADESAGDSYEDSNGVLRTDQEVVGRSRLRVDTRKWLLSKCLPKIYGDKQQLEVSGNLGIGDLLDELNRREKNAGL